nr:2-C-methyl-D-erythritol 4-phosphate cytidylyltransferase [uncultured Prevotella sp.]
MIRYAIIVAGGKGLRMGTEVPKQFLPIAGKPVLMHTISRFHAYDEHLKVILVLPKEQQEYWNQLCEEYHFIEDYQLADGGASRFQSCRNGLSMIPNDTEGLVGIHDGVRPFVSNEAISRCYDAAEKEKAVIPVLPVTDTLRFVGDSDKGRNVLRSDYRVVQTPQVFDIQLLKKAYNQPESTSFTDDASVVESIGQAVTMVEGNRENIKITTPFDLKVAEILV